MANNSETLDPAAILRGILDGSLTELDAGDATKIGLFKLRKHSGIQSLSAREATSAGGYIIYEAGALETVTMPKLNDVDQNTLEGASQLKTVDVNGKRFFGAALANTKVDTLIIRSTEVARMININAISNTPFKNGGGVERYIFQRPSTTILETVLRSITRALRTGLQWMGMALSPGRKLKEANSSTTTQTVLRYHNGKGVMVYG